MGSSGNRSRLFLNHIRFIVLIAALLIIFTIILYVEKQDKVDLSNSTRNGLTREEEMSLRSLKKIDDHPLYIMTYYGDYGFKKYLKKGRDIESVINKKSDNWACSCFSALNKSGDKIYGRNLDWRYSPKLLLFTDPPDGYASVTMVDISYLGFFKEDDIENATMDELKRLLEAPYLTFDGMNECGVAIGEMSVYGSKSSIDPNKVTLGANTIMRLVLDYAKDVDEAVELFRSYNVYFPPAPPLHYLVSDSQGNSAVIEYINGELKVIRNQKPWQVATNFFIYNIGKDSEVLCRRYRTAEAYLTEKNGLITEEEAMNLLHEISQGSTQWSVVYNMTNGNIKIVMGKKYDSVLSFKLPVRN